MAWQLVVTLLLAALAVATIDLGELVDAVQHATLWWVPLGLLLFTTEKFVDSWRWRYLLRGVSAHAIETPRQAVLFGAFLVGNMVNNLLPLRAGDLAKVQVLANRYGASRAGVAASLFVVEATLDALVFVVFLLAGVAFWGVGDLPAFTRTAIGLLAAGAATGMLVALVLSREPSRFAGAIKVIPGRWRPAAVAQLSRAAEGLHALRSWRRTAGAIALSVPAWLMEAGVFTLFGQAFGLDHGYGTYIAVMVAANVAVAVPVALGNFGPYEVLVTGVLVAAGTDEAAALAYALAVHVLTSAWIIVTGLLAFWALRLSPRDVFALGRGD
jgi:uncharacterized membrane protein YbhN (UPF0104 family)